MDTTVKKWLRIGIVAPVATFLMATTMFIGSPAMAEDNLDPLGGGSGTSQEDTPRSVDDIIENGQGSRNSGETNTNSGDKTRTEQEIADQRHEELSEKANKEGQKASDSFGFIKDINPVADNNPNDNPMLKKVLEVVGFLISAGVWILILLTLLQSVIDMAYILLPWIRPTLVDANEDGQGSPMPGFGGGSVGMGGFGAGGANQTSQKRAFLNRNWASDEAISSVKLLGGAAQAQMGGGGMAGSPMSGFGGYGAMGAMPEQDSNSRKTVLGDYFKARVKVFIVLGIAIVLLTSTALLGLGMNFAAWLLKVITYAGYWIAGAEVPNLF